jgi:antitoxin (DNA-binding transcriptional repressor) of toxin-antitoxin stability system
MQNCGQVRYESCFRGCRSRSDNGCISPFNCVTLCHMKRTTVRELHLQTSAIVRAVAEGESFIVEKSGVPVAEIRPLEQASTRRRLPNREAIISKMPRVGDSGRILEEDRS